MSQYTRTSQRTHYYVQVPIDDDDDSTVFEGYLVKSIEVEKEVHDLVRLLEEENQSLKLLLEAYEKPLLPTRQKVDLSR